MTSARSFPLAALATLLLMAGGPVLAGADADKDVSGAMLLAEDLPEGLESQGVTHNPQFDFDSASFEANGGLDAVNQIWVAPDITPDLEIVIVFDFRFLFPDEASAVAYLDAAEPILSESSTGLTIRTDGVSVGDDTRHYAGSLSQGALTTANENVLFRRGPVVAKVYISGFDVPFDAAAVIAEAAGERTDSWLADAGLSASPGASGSPQASEGPAASELPSGSAPPDAQGFLRQWASGAEATSEYTFDKWSANDATGEPDVVEWADDPNAWTTFSSDSGIHSIALTYDTAVVPREVNVVESFNGGAVVRIEAWDADAEAWGELWSGSDPTPSDELATFSPELEPVGFATNTIRVTLDTDLVPGFNQIDAVELVGALQ